MGPATQKKHPRLYILRPRTGCGRVILLMELSPWRRDMHTRVPAKSWLTMAMETHLGDKIAPPNWAALCWVPLYESCLTQDNLSKSKIPTVNRCYMCQKEYEGEKHLFLHCTVSCLEHVCCYFWTRLGCLTLSNMHMAVGTNGVWESLSEGFG